MDDAAPQGDPTVQTRGLGKRYGAIQAVRQLDLVLSPGEVYGLLGPNGAGKSTTLRMLAGLARPSEGSALVAGAPPGTEASLRRTGFMVESPAFWPYLSGRDNLRALAPYARAGRPRVEQLLTSVGLLERAGDRVSGYSMGMRQRLGIAAALLKDPSVLLLDEPMNGLDPAGIIGMRGLLQGLAAEGRTVLLSSHLLHEVEQTCTRVGVIREGRLIAEGTVAELRGEAGIFVRCSPRDKAMAILTQLLGSDKVTGSDGALTLAIPLARAAEVNARLVGAGVEVSELREAERSLEDIFMQLTEAPP